VRGLNKTYRRGGEFVFQVRNYLRAQLRRILTERFAVYGEAARGLVAGYGPSKGAYRPGFAWFFGRDSFWTSFALTAAGDFDSARAAIDFIAKYQREDGKIPHEISQAASLVPWFKDFPYAYASADEYLADAYGRSCCTCLVLDVRLRGPAGWSCKNSYSSRRAFPPSCSSAAMAISRWRSMRCAMAPSISCKSPSRSSNCSIACTRRWYSRATRMCYARRTKGSRRERPA